MVLTIDKTTRRQKIDVSLFNRNSRKLFPAEKFLGKINWGEDALEYQKRLRNEWN